MAQTDKYSVQNLKQEFPNDDVCLEYLFKTLHSRKCSCGGKYARLKGRLQFQCSQCRFQIAPMTGTLFEKSSTPLTLWFHAIFIFSNAKSGISAKEMERQLGVTYKTAWRILKLIRASLKQDTRKLKGDVEMDDGYMGGRFRAGKGNKRQIEAMAAKVPLIGAVERKGDLRVKTFQTVSSITVDRFLKENVDHAGTRLLTDESNRYFTPAKLYKRETVNHSKKEYVRGDVHINSMENFWGHIKRSITGTHKMVSKKYMPLYLDGFVFHYNNRYSDRERFASLLAAVVRL